MLLILTRIWQKLLFVELIFSEFNPKTMKSTRIPNLYLAGGVLDFHGLTGGYNLKIAFSTGYLAGFFCR